jgi:hypothetical protein
MVAEILTITEKYPELPDIQKTVINLSFVAGVMWAINNGATYNNIIKYVKEQGL